MFSKTAKTPDPVPTAKVDTGSPTPTPAPAPAPAPTTATPTTTVTPSSSPAEARKPKVATLIAEHMSVEGGISGEGELQVDGVVRGDVRVARLTIGETGHVEGSIVCEAVEIRGRVVGTVTAKQVRLYATAFMDGDITHEQLAMEVGAFFQGRSLKFQRPAGATPDKVASSAGSSTSAPIPPPASKDGSAIEPGSKVVN